MCDQREQLIGYVYEECDAADRRRVEEHLASCDTCRREISGLRRVRQDLLAWDVPQSESIWRPFAPVRTVPSWRDVPAWAFAAAASVILLAGAAGGVVTEAVLTRAQPQSQMASASTATRQVSAVTPADLSAFETRMLATVRSEMDQRVQAVVAHQTSGAPVAVRASADTEDLKQQVKRLSDNQLDLYTAVSNDFSRQDNRIGNMERLAQQVSWQVPAAGR